MFAVIKTGGRQYRVAADEVLKVEKLAGEPGDSVTFGDVLMLGGDEPKVGSPLVSGASVAAEIVEQGRGPKIIIFKKRRRHNSRRKNGHRQPFTLVRVTDILTDGAKPQARKAKAEKPKKAETQESEAAPAAKPKAKVAKPKAKAKTKPAGETKEPAKKPRARRAPKKSEGGKAKK
jgi:large subunit ribosomal protein L21